MGRSVMAAAVLAVLWPAGADGQREPVEAAMSVVAFMAGCWEGSAGPGRTILERYGPATENVMLGTTLFLRDERAISHELVELVRTEDGLIRMTPYPGGTESEHPFFLTHWTESSAVFEAPEHDFPKRIIYSRLPDGRLQARIDGGAEDPRPRTWVMAPVSCDPGG